MSEQDSGHSGQHLEVGRAISISLFQADRRKRPRETGLAATIEKISPDKLWLRLLRPIPELPVQEGERIRIKSWSKEAVYFWDAEVLKVSGSAKQHVTISRRDEGVTLQRRHSYRVHSEIPLSFTVIDPHIRSLIGKKVANSKTQNISVSGLQFETTLSLVVGDRLKVHLDLPSSQKVRAVGQVVRSKKIERNEEHVNLIALKFLELGPEEQDQLLPFLAESRTRDENEETGS